MTLSDMTTDALLAERRKLDTTLFAPKALAVNITVVTLAIGMALYAMKDGFSYILTAIILALVYSVARRVMDSRRIDAELAARR